ncbi:MAG: hypothetical protein WCP56_00110 [Candidatus Saccharibacteria bacterium]
MGETGRPNPGPVENTGVDAEAIARLNQAHAEQAQEDANKQAAKLKRLEEKAGPSGVVYPKDRNTR